MIILASCRSESEIRSYLCQSKRMCRRIDLRYNIHSVYEKRAGEIEEEKQAVIAALEEYEGI